MSFFGFLKKKTPETPEKKEIPTEPTPITWENTVNPDDFFTGYSAAITTLEADGKIAAAETLRANKSAYQLDFIARFETHSQQQLAQIENPDERAQQAITLVKQVRQYNKQMPIAVRTRLAQAKKNLIGE